MSQTMMPSRLPDPDYDHVYFDGVLPKRFFAWVIDAALVLVTMLLLSILTAGIAVVLWIPIHATVAFLYRWTTIRNRSATLGMRLMNIELRGPRGERLSPAEAAIHTACYLFAAFFFLIQLVSIAMMIGRPLNRSLSDEIVGSVMINRPA